MRLVSIARISAALTLLALGMHVSVRVMTHYGVREDTLFERSEARLARARVPETPVLLLLGDSGAASPELRANFEAMSREPALLALHAGDIGYRGPREYGRFLKAADALPFPIFVVPGDHDHDGAHGYQLWDALFGGRDRVVEKDGLRVVLLDTSSDRLSEASFRFLDAALAPPPAPQAPPRWIVVLTHAPPYKPGSRGPQARITDHALKDIAGADALLVRLRQANVTLLCAGHIHGFGRGDQGGVPLVVSGGGGKDVDPGSAFHYVRITLGDPPTIEQVITSPGSGRRPLERLADGTIAESLSSGDRTAIALAAATAVLFAFARRCAPRR